MNFQNDVAISSRWQVLKLLVRNWGDRTERLLMVWPNEEPHIEVASFRGPYDSYNASSLWRITPEVKDWLIQLGFVRGKPKWGYTSDMEFMPTERASTWIFRAVGITLHSTGGCSPIWKEAPRE